MTLLRISHVLAGITAVFVGYSSSAVIIIQAMSTLQASTDVQAAWLFALGIAMGVSTLVLTWRYKMPILTAWSTPGAALLMTALSGATLGQAVGVFMCASLLMVITAVTGLFNRLVNWVPRPIAAALLAGILVQFALAIVPALKQEPLLVGTMIVTYAAAKHYSPRWVFVWVISIVIVASLITNSFDSTQLTLTWPRLYWQTPELHLPTIISVSLPLFLVTLVSQNVPGMLMLRAHGYQPPMAPLISATGLTSLMGAPFGVYSANLAAISAGICQTPDVDDNPSQRYKSTLVAGVAYLFMGCLGVGVVSLFSALSHSVIASLAGLALLGTITSSLADSMAEQDARESATVTFVIAASGVSFFELNSVFWALLVGVSWHRLLKQKSTK